MKSRRDRNLVKAALVTAFMLLNYSSFAQVPIHQKEAGGQDAATEGRMAATKEPVFDARAAVQAAPNAAKPPAAIIGFLPADILNSYEVGLETRYSWSWSSVLPSSAGKNKRQGDENDTADLAKRLRNPVSPLARILMENDLAFGLSADREGYRYTMNLEPLIPFALNSDWNLISRTRMQVIQQDGVVASTMQTGFGDILQSFFLSPNSTEPVFWGAGTTLLIPTATDTKLGTGKFGLGPAVVVGKQTRGWTVGALARHIWSVAGHSDRADVRSTYIQPFVAYTTRSAWTYSFDTEFTHDWVGKEWSAPMHVEISKVVKIGRHPISIGGALTCWAATFTGGPQACGVRFNVTPLFPAR